MQRPDVDYPGYGFAVHKGYTTPAYGAAVAKLGLSPTHRRSVHRRKPFDVEAAITSPQGKRRLLRARRPPKAAG